MQYTSKLLVWVLCGYGGFGACGGLAFSCVWGFSAVVGWFWWALLLLALLRLLGWWLV